MSAYLSAVLADLPRHYWRVADFGGLTLVDIGSTREDMYAAAGAPQLGYSGPISDGGSCYFPGNAYFRSAASISRTPPYSIEAWLYQAAPPTTTAWIASLSNTAIGTTATNAFLQGTIVGFFWTSATSLVSQTWNHCVLTVTSTQFLLYLNGAPVNTTNHALGAQNRNDYIGSDGTNSIQGWVAEVADYNYAIGLPRIQAHYNAADNLARGPFFKQGGTFNPTTGVVVSNTDLLAEILAAVKKTFPTT
jgi:hypothetical protein